ncbi:hypothetical protein AKJ09_03494 [Labilithrix luteola]|uniref:Uncharacterized protein n=1 Tax=Labilithrix luteola TaxID=1391654 RepID=A0A0K1PTH4_9BACT|nr:hypothetical protein AKJ09_03494 [Labilithrix luteola]
MERLATVSGSQTRRQGHLSQARRDVDEGLSRVDVGARRAIDVRSERWRSIGAKKNSIAGFLASEGTSERSAQTPDLIANMESANIAIRSLNLWVDVRWNGEFGEAQGENFFPVNPDRSALSACSRVKFFCLTPNVGDHIRHVDHLCRRTRYGC